MKHKYLHHGKIRDVGNEKQNFHNGKAVEVKVAAAEDGKELGCFTLLDRTPRTPRNAYAS